MDPIEAQSQVDQSGTPDAATDVMAALEASISPEEATALQAEFGADGGTDVAPPPASDVVASPSSPSASAPAFDPRELLSTFQAQAQAQAQAFEQLLQVEREKSAQALARIEALTAPKKEPRQEDPSVAEFRKSIFDDLNDHPVVKEAKEAKARADETQKRLDGILQQQNYAQMKASAEHAVENVFLKGIGQHLEPAEAAEIRPLLKELSYAAALTLGQHSGQYVSPADAAVPLAKAIQTLVKAQQRALNVQAKASVAARAQAPRAVAVATEPGAGSGQGGYKPTRDQINQFYGGDSWAAAMDAERGYPRIPR